MTNSSNSYAKDRLWTGISGVGLWVLAASIFLVLQPHVALLEGRAQGLLASALFIGLGFLGLALLALPFDILGGLVLPRRHGRPAPSGSAFAVAWLRGVVVLAAVAATAGCLLLAAGQAGGRPAAVGALMAVSLMLLAIQEPLARWVGGLRRVPARESVEGDEDLSRAIFLKGGDPAFTGGFTGLGARPVLPERWMWSLDPKALGLLLRRRQGILQAGGWRRSIALALLWNGSGFLLASLLPGAGVTSLAELVTTALGFTLWTFVGLLLLPTPSRAATLVADARVADTPERKQRLLSTVQQLDRWQDDEPERTPGVESVFHPVPSVARRERNGADPDQASAWHLARTVLFLSHVGLSLLPRAVHCNVGRPELWVYLPADG